MSRVWIVLQQEEGRLTRQAKEAMVAGQRLAGEIGGTAEAVLLGSNIGALAEEIAGSTKLAALRVVDHPALEVYTPGAYISLLAPALREAAPAYVVFAHAYQSVDYFPRLAQEIEAGLLPEVTGWRREGDEFLWNRPILGGKMGSTVRMKGEGTVLLSVQSGAFPASGLEAGSAPVEALSSGEVTPDREILSIEDAGGNQVDLTRADVIVAVGRGVGGEDKLGPVRELAEVLGADIGASRPVIDSGWLERDRQIGSSGQTVAPKLYIAVGVSGAIQHAVGMKGSSCVVAINKDAGAPIFGMAKYGIVGDLHEVVPALIAALKER
ncbi:MAG: electron transfer flavoprotein subunit alpha/FixB family protein [Acidobacteriota bacterium]